jgi:hypothetical protein
MARRVERHRDPCAWRVAHGLNRVAVSGAILSARPDIPNSVLHGPKWRRLAASVDAGHRAIMGCTICTRYISPDREAIERHWHVGRDNA